MLNITLTENSNINNSNHMNKYLFVLTTLLMFLIGCSSDSSVDESFLQTHVTPVASPALDSNQLDPELQATIDNLQAFNDSILASQADVDIQRVTKKDWTVVNADAEGFMHGLIYGWKHGKGFFGKLATSVTCAVAFSTAASLLAAFGVYILDPLLGNDSDSGLMSYNNGYTELDNPYTYTQYQYAIALGGISNNYEVELNSFKNRHTDLLIGDTVVMRNAVLHNQIIEKISKKTYAPQVLKLYFTDGDLSFLNQSSSVNFYNTVPDRYKGIIGTEFTEPLNDKEYTYAKEILSHFNQAVRDITGSIHGVGMTTLNELAARYISSTNADGSKISQKTISEIQTGIYLTVMSAEYWSTNGSNFKINE